MYGCVVIQAGMPLSEKERWTMAEPRSISRWLDLIPAPRQCRRDTGWFVVPRTPLVGIADHRLVPVARMLLPAWPRMKMAASTTGSAESLRVIWNRRLKPEGYRLRIATSGITMEAVSVEGARHGMRTLLQILSRTRECRVPCLTIT